MIRTKFTLAIGLIFICFTNYAQTELWGMTGAGGTFNRGTIFKTDGSGNNQTIEYNCTKIAGESPACTQLIQATDGKLYGMTSAGGILTGTLGVLFQYDPTTNIYTHKVDFNGINGSAPKASLIQAADGKLYGMTPDGGINYAGVLFQYDPVTNIYSKKIDFSTTNGRTPNGSLTEAVDGKLYGLTQYGGGGSSGVLFQYDPVTNVYTKKVEFMVAGTGKYPRGSLVEAQNGKLYGTTKNGGVNNKGVVFEYDPLTGIYTETFDITVAGGVMENSMVAASDGKLYGMTAGGGTNSKGVIFQYDPSTQTWVTTFNFDGAAHGSEPRSSLMQASDGKLYGMTYSGGINDLGTFFQYDPVTASVTKLVDYDMSVGKYPEGTLMQASNGKLYGMVKYGGNGYGSIFEYGIATTSYITKLSFGESKEGSQPNGSLIKASDGKLYGTMQMGGSAALGVIFQYDPATHSYTKKIDFLGSSNGKVPKSSLMQASDGMLYGMTSTGGTGNGGVLYQYDPTTNTYVVKVNFTGAANGATPQSALIQATDGYLYGLTFDGGANSYGTLFRYDIAASTYTKMVDFDGVAKGQWPTGPLVQASDGNLYGHTLSGGANNVGVLFQFNPVNNTFTKKMDFIATNGSLPTCLMQAANGKLYGMTQTGGANNVGVIFQYDVTTNTYVKKIDLVMANGGYPMGGLTQASDGNLYGLTSSGGTKSIGTMFQYDPVANIYTKKFDFDTTNGGQPFLTNLLEITASPVISTNTINLVNCAGGAVNVPFTISSGTFSPGNVFTAQLSDALGSFTSPVPIGSLTATTAGTVNAVIPMVITAGNNYRIRITSSIPAVTGSDNGSSLSINECVWPGDANSDGTTDNLDILELGLHYAQTGAPRASSSNAWQSYFANNWVGTITNGKNLNHSDCNGDGVINDDDTLAIYNNYGLTHAFKPAQTTMVNPQLSIVPDQPMVTKGNWGTASVYLGNTSNPINDINGIAFTVDFDNTLIEPNSIYIEYQNSFMDAGQNLHFQKLDFANSKLFTASTHTLSNNVSGDGKIATLHYQILSSLTTDQVLSIGLSQVNQSDATGTIIPLTSGTGTLMAIGASVGLQETASGGYIVVSPNPTNGILNINLSAISQNTKAELYNAVGALMMTESLSNKTNTITIADLSAGLYFVKVIENDKVVAVKKVVKE